MQKSIDEMVTALLKEKEDEIAHKDYCNKAIAENELQTAVPDSLEKFFSFLRPWT